MMSTDGLIKENIDLSHIYLAVENEKHNRNKSSQFGLVEEMKCQLY